MVAVDRAVAGAGMIEEGYLVPLSAGQGGAPSYLLVGLSPALPFDAAYRRFLEQVAGYLQVARTRVEEAERRAAAELEEKRLLAQRETLLADLEVGEPRQGRIPGHARARAAQPAVADRDRASAHAREERTARAARAGDHRTAGRSPDASGRRSAGRGADRARQGGAAPRDRRRRRRRDQGRGDRGRPAGEAAPPPGDRVRARPLLVQRRSGSAVAGRRQPAHERREIHRPWRGRSPWSCRATTTR